MKKLTKLVAVAAAILTFGLAFTACSDSDDNNDEVLNILPAPIGEDLFAGKTFSTKDETLTDFDEYDEYVIFEFNTDKTVKMSYYTYEDEEASTPETIQYAKYSFNTEKKKFIFN